MSGAWTRRLSRSLWASALTIGAPCVLASERPSHPDDERRSANPSELLTACAADAVREIPPLGELGARGLLPCQVGVLGAENRAEPEETAGPEALGDVLAERLRAEVPGVVVENVPHGSVEALLLSAAGLGAQSADLLRVVHGRPRDVAAVRLEADLGPGLARVSPPTVAAPAPVGRLLPVPADGREDV